MYNERVGLTTAPPPGAPPGAPPRAAGSLSCCGRPTPINVHWWLAVGTLLTSVACAAIIILSLISIFGNFNLLAFIVGCYLAFQAILLGFSALWARQWVANYFGFLNYPFGSGSLLLLIGASMLGFGTTGQIAGGFAIAWGVISIICHFWMRGAGCAFNTSIIK